MTYKEIISNYLDTPGGIIETFQAIQEEYGYLPEEAIREAARAFKISAAEAYGVATFYKKFNIKPRGKEKSSNTDASFNRFSIPLSSGIKENIN